MKNPTDVAGKWASRLGAATQDIQRGVQAVTVAPGAAAAAQRQKWVQRVTASQDKWARNVSRVSLADWQAATINKGIPRVASGAQAAQPKMEQFMSELLPHIERGLPALKAMPGVTLDDGINRSSAWIRHMATFRRSGAPSGGQ